jgi:hypothetical protein
MTLASPAALVLTLALAGLSAPAAAFDRIADRDAFVQAVRDKALTRLAVNLRVTPEGRIEGRAFGQQVTGTWSWREGYFCREMRTRVRDVPANCQLVERAGDVLRFTSDRGRGDSAELRLR